MEETIKKPMINIMMYHTIANNDNTIKLDIMENEKGLYMPSLEWIEDGKEIFSADNSEWIFGEFLNSLRAFETRTMTEAEKKEFESYTEVEITEKIVLDIIEILEKGIELGWNKVD